MNWQKQGIDLPRLCCDASADRWEGGGDGGWGGGVAFHWSMLRNAYAQRPLDGTSETSPVLLRLLKDGLVGAVSITL